ncbi:hypothetical protein OPS25_13755 [Alteromonas ponticola]|uniref:Ion channel n=1 Tax=Alteromonas aquimaris TaxID=2998417 RepID=A0ABT3P9X3_9ALTE|nr:hypothetical protein [Alteromonas aquimaris]MCW8109569.1 hypothetical protein [Alteromonas aquimaris]
MFIAIAGSFIMTLMVIAFHYYTLRAVTSLSEQFSKGFKRNVTVVSCIFCIHCVEIVWFAFDLFIAYEVVGLRGFEEDFSGSVQAYLHLSASSFTTLGAFVSTPKENIALVLDMISLTGFTMLTWSATHYYSIFSR